MSKSYELLSDIVIPKGTRFSTAPRKTERYSDEIVDTVIGLTKDTCGVFTYDVDSGCEDIGKFFREVV